MAEHDTAHVVIPPSTYAKNFGLLLVLMLLTIFAAQIDLGANWINNVVALMIATVKAVLVILFFMGVKYGTKLTKLWAITGFVWFFLLAGIYVDYATRSWESQTSGWDPREERKEKVTGSDLGVGTNPPHEEPVAPVPGRN